MAQNNGNSSHWSIQRRVEGLVNKHMADMALETLQHRLNAVSEEISSLAEEAATRRAEDVPRRAEDVPRRADVTFDMESQSDIHHSGGVGEKLMPTAASSGKRFYCLFLPGDSCCEVNCQFLCIHLKAFS